jgi:hydrogenase maturation factor
MKFLISFIVCAALAFGQTTKTPLTAAQIAALSAARNSFELSLHAPRPEYLKALAAYEAVLRSQLGAPIFGSCVNGARMATRIGTDFVSAITTAKLESCILKSGGTK